MLLLHAFCFLIYIFLNKEKANGKKQKSNSLLCVCIFRENFSLFECYVFSMLMAVRIIRGNKVLKSGYLNKI